jgi:signal transduction histidine kinase
MRGGVRVRVQNDLRGKGVSASFEVGFERFIDRVLDEAVRRGERWMSICRVIFALATFVRFLGVIEPDKPDFMRRLWLKVPAGCLFIGFSLWMIARTRRGPVSTRLLGLSVAVDAGMAFVALVGNAIFADRNHYRGIFMALDGAALLLVIMISGLRLSPAVVWLSAALNTVSAATLVLIDRIVPDVSIVYSRNVLVLMAIFGGSAVILALIVAHQTRALAVAGARDSLRAHLAQQSLGSLLQDHHDVRSLISSANLNAEALQRGMGTDHPHRIQAEHLCADLRAVSALISTLRERAFQELTASDGRLDAPVASAVRAVTALVARRFPAIRIDEQVPEGLRVRLAGGVIVLERVLLNLLINACEGDGARGAATVWIRAHRDEGGVHLRIEDDGPGFPDAVLHAPLAHAASTKPQGSGLGLFLVHAVISASAARLTLGRRAGGGAIVDIELPAATD